MELILVSNIMPLKSDSNDPSIMCISCKTKKFISVFLVSSQHEQTIQWSLHTKQLTPVVVPTHYSPEYAIVVIALIQK